MGMASKLANLARSLYANTVGNIGIGAAALAAAKLYIVGSTSDSTTQAIRAQNSATADVFFVRNDGSMSVGISSKLTLDATGTLAFNSGYGSAATAYGCRAWVNFNGQGTVAIRGSGNVSSVTDLGTGNYRINLSTSLPDLNYAVCCGSYRAASWVSGGDEVASQSVSYFNWTHYENNTATDTPYLMASVFR